MSAPVKCRICGFRAQHLFGHLRSVHTMSPGEYTSAFPGSPLATKELLRHLESSPPDPADSDTFSLFGVSFPHITPGSSPFIPERNPSYIFDETLSRHVLLSLKNNEKLLLSGPTGCGKSSLVEQLAARLSWPVIRVASSGGLQENDLLGEWLARDGATTFNYGFLPQAMSMGAICLIDEVDTLEPSVSQCLQELLEDSGKLTLVQNGGEVIRPHQSFRFIATANTLGLGDDSGVYVGTKVQNAAFLDRFVTFIRMDFPEPDRERAILYSHCPRCDSNLIGMLLIAVTDVREAAKRRAISGIVSTRLLIALLRKFLQLGQFLPALSLSILNRMSDEDATVVREVFQRHLGSLEFITCDPDPQ